MSYNSHHWGAPTASGQSTGEGGSSLEMEPMIGASGNIKGAGAPGSSKYHGKRTSPGSAGRIVLVTLACLAMLYFGYGVGRDAGLETPRQPNASPTPSLVRKPPAIDQSKEVRPEMTDRPNDDDEPSDEDAEDDQMLESASSAEDEAGRGNENEAEANAVGGDDGEADAHENDGGKEEEEDPADAVTGDEAAREDNEDEDDDATQDFAPDGDSDDNNDEDSMADTDDDDDGDEEDDANAIAKMLVPNGVSDTPTTAYRVPDAVHNRFVKWSKELHEISEMEEYKGGEPRVNWEWHPRKRADRFPAVDDRVRVHLH